MPKTIDNRFRCPTELWRQFLDVCNTLEVDHKMVMISLLTYFVLEKRLPSAPTGTGNTYYAPAPIPQIKKTSDPYINELLSDELFT